jgi:hypothetical protein
MTTTTTIEQWLQLQIKWQNLKNRENGIAEEGAANREGVEMAEVEVGWTGMKWKAVMCYFGAWWGEEGFFEVVWAMEL